MTEEKLVERVTALFADSDAAQRKMIRLYAETNDAIEASAIIDSGAEVLHMLQGGLRQAGVGAFAGSPNFRGASAADGNPHSGEPYRGKSGLHLGGLFHPRLPASDRKIANGFPSRTLKRAALGPR